MTAEVTVVAHARCVYRIRGLGGKILAGGGLLIMIGLIGLFAQVIAPYDPIQQNVFDRLASPSSAHWFGTDSVGRDEYCRVIYAIRVDIWVGVVAALIPAVIGTLVGALAAYYRRWAEAILMPIADLTQAFPIYVLILVLVFTLGPGVRSIIIAYAVIDWVVYARLARAEVLRIRPLEYVQAVQVTGLTSRRILFRHILPNAIRQPVIYYFSDVVLAILTLAGFSYLGLGVAPPTPEWGAMIADGQTYIQAQWWLATIPGLVIVMVGFALSLIADGLHDRAEQV
jgi:peptide/nickel transport system permease protein